MACERYRHIPTGTPLSASLPQCTAKFGFFSFTIDLLSQYPGFYADAAMDLRVLQQNCSSHGNESNISRLGKLSCSLLYTSTGRSLCLAHVWH